MSTRLTALAVEKIKGGMARREIADAGCPNLYLVVQVTGSKSWAIRCRINGQPTKITLGPYPRLDLAAAREQARQTLALVDRGIDPRQHRAEEQREHASRRANTLRVVAEQFRDKRMKQVRPRSWKSSWAALDRYALSRLGDRPIASIRRRDLHEILDDLADKPGTRHNVLNALSSLFRWAVDREIVEANPATQMPRPKAVVRERALSDAEIPVVWEVAEAVGYTHSDESSSCYWRPAAGAERSPGSSGRKSISTETPSPFRPSVTKPRERWLCRSRRWRGY